jgi:glutamate carboxypeptidase
MRANSTVRGLTLPLALRAAALALLCVSTIGVAKDAHQQSRDKVEQGLVTTINASEDAAFALLEQLVNINSGTLNVQGVRKVADVLRPKFEALGFKVTWEDGTPYERAGHLIAERAGRGPHILLIGHLDTVFEPDHPFQRYELKGESAVGPATADMKGGIVVGLAALQALHRQGVLDQLQLTVVLHGDEEDAGTPVDAARATLIDAAKAADIAIGLENADDDPKTAIIARRSSSRWQVKTTGTSAHSSQIFTNEVGAGAINELARILHRFYEELRGEDFLTFNPGLISGSTQLNYSSEPLRAEASGKDNIVAPHAVASGDLRAISMDQRERIKARMREIVAASLPGTKATIEFDDGYPPMAPTDGNRKLLSVYDQVSRDLGFGPVGAVDPRKAGAADISFAADHVEMAIDGLGLLGGDSHTAEEFADLRTYQTQTQRLAVLLYRLSKQQR